MNDFCIRADSFVLKKRRIRIYRVRHRDGATWMVMEGVPLAEVARLLGDSERTVEKVYGKHAPDYLRRAVSALNFKSKPPTLCL